MDSRILRTLQGIATPAEEAEVARWRASSKANEEEYRELQRVWQLTGLLKWQESSPPAPAVEDLLDRNRKRPGSWWKTAAAIAAACGALLFAANEFGAPEEFRVREIVTGAGETATAELEDGTIVRLAGSSRLRVKSMKGDRAVALDGRAFFAVAKDSRRPFRVQAGSGEVTVLGTQFDLRARDEDLQLVVVEGAVEFSSAGETIRVNAGEASQLTETGSPRLLQISDVDEHVHWIGPLLVFQATPLDEVAQAVQDRFGQPVVVMDRAVAERTVTAWFSTAEPWQVMSAVCRVVDASCRMSGDTIVVEAGQSVNP